VLVSTLWLLALLTIAASFFAVWTQRSIELAGDLQTDAQAQIDQVSTLSTLLYILATQRMTTAGVTTADADGKRTVRPPDADPFGGLGIAPEGNEIALDDRVYQGIGEVYFAIQDQNGLVGLNNEDDAFYPERLLQLLGVPDAERAPMLAKLQDYIDADDLYRVNGAEADQYEEAQQTPPTNRPLRSPWETYKILGWAQQRRLWDNSDWVQYTSNLGGGLPNLNTAPALALQTIPGIDADGAARLVKFRHIYPIDKEERVYQALGFRIVLDEFGTVFMASDHLRITLWHKNEQRMQRLYLELSPFKNKEKPWRLHYMLELPLHSLYQHPELFYAKTPLFPAALPTNPS